MRTAPHPAFPLPVRRRPSCWLGPAPGARTTAASESRPRPGLWEGGLRTCKAGPGGCGNRRSTCWDTSWGPLALPALWLWEQPTHHRTVPGGAGRSETRTHLGPTRRQPTRTTAHLRGIFVAQLSASRMRCQGGPSWEQRPFRENLRLGCGLQTAPGHPPSAAPQPRADTSVAGL